MLLVYQLLCVCFIMHLQVKIMKEWDPTGRNGPRTPLPDVVKVRVTVVHGVRGGGAAQLCIACVCGRGGGHSTIVHCGLNCISLHQFAVHAFLSVCWV
jgi:hypothetical protein